MIWRVARRPVDSTQWHKLASKSRGHPLQCTCLVQKSVANYLNDSYFYRRGERECVRNYLIHTKPLWKSRSRRPASKQDPTEAIPFFLLPDRIHFYILRGNQIAKLNHHVKEQKMSNFHPTAFRLSLEPNGFVPRIRHINYPVILSNCFFVCQRLFCFVEKWQKMKWAK